MVGRSLRPISLTSMWVVLFLAACSSAQAPSRSGPGAPPPPGSQPDREKTIVVGITGAVEAMPIMGSSSTTGGWHSLDEVFAQGLITADRDTRRPVPRLASKVPAFNDGSIEILSDGRMRTVYPLRTDVTWHDGTPFTAQDLIFSFELASDPNLPRLSVAALSQISTVEAPDDRTFVIYWKGPYYQADAVGTRAFWPLPKHILEEPYRTLERQAFYNLAFWTTEYIHLGPFRLTEVRAGDLIIFSAYDNYFLGRPKVNRMIVRMYNDENVLFAATLAGSIDLLTDASLGTEQTLELKETWDRTGAGTVHIAMGTTRFISPQFDPVLQRQPALFDARVRQALTFAIDRVALSESTQRGHGELVADALLPPGDRLYEAVKGGFARYTYDPTRAKAILTQVGWSPAGDGMLVGLGGAPLTVAIWTGLDREMAVVADYWKQIGVGSELSPIPQARSRDREFRQSYPGVELSAAGYGDAILIRMDSRDSPTPPNFSGTNRGHYANPRMDQLIDQYRQSVNERDQAQAIKAISDFVVEELPVMLLYYNASGPAARKGIKAFDDVRGGVEATQLYGTYSRNAHEWDVM